MLEADRNLVTKRVKVAADYRVRSLSLTPRLQPISACSLMASAASAARSKYRSHEWSRPSSTPYSRKSSASVVVGKGLLRVEPAANLSHEISIDAGRVPAQPDYPPVALRR
jgi:hypothetical protein